MFGGENNDLFVRCDFFLSYEYFIKYKFEKISCKGTPKESEATVFELKDWGEKDAPTYFALKTWPFKTASSRSIGIIEYCLTTFNVKDDKYQIILDLCENKDNFLWTNYRDSVFNKAGANLWWEGSYSIKISIFLKF